MRFGSIAKYAGTHSCFPVCSLAKKQKQKKPIQLFRSVFGVEEVTLSMI